MGQGTDDHQGIKAYKSKSNSLSNSQILFEDYNYEEALLVLKEMVELNVQNLVESHRVTDHIGLYIGYSARNVKATGGSRKLSNVTNSYAYLRNAFIELYRETVKSSGAGTYAVYQLWKCS